MARRQSINVNLSSFDVEEQRREFERFKQERADRDLALRLQRQNEPQALRNRLDEDVIIERHRAPGPAPGPVRPTNRRRVFPEEPPRASHRIPGERPQLSIPSTRTETITRLTVVDQQFRVFIRSSVESDDHPQSDSESSEGSDSSESSESASDSDNASAEAAGVQIQIGNDRRAYAGEYEINAPGSGQSTSSGARNVYNSPPPRVGTPIPQWGDCTLCFEVPIKPQGCNGCLQIIGCQTCVQSWFHSAERPSCPLCRRKWNRQPDVSFMGTIERRNRIRNRTRALHNAGDNVIN